MLLSCLGSLSIMDKIACQVPAAESKIWINYRAAVVWDLIGKFTLKLVTFLVILVGLYIGQTRNAVFYVCKMSGEELGSHPIMDKIARPVPAAEGKIWINYKAVFIWDLIHQNSG